MAGGSASNHASSTASALTGKDIVIRDHILRDKRNLSDRIASLLAANMTKSGEFRQLCVDLKYFLAYLKSIEMTSGMLAATAAEEMLETLLNENIIELFPEEIVKLARYLKAKWSRPQAGPEPLLDRAYPPLARSTVRSRTIPPDDHDIWGVRGIMYGAEQGETGGRAKKRADLRSKPSKVYGHNEIPVGTWYPSQLLAMIHGAHGSLQDGIAGDDARGAYSIVLSGNCYSELDKDEGNIIYYAGAGSHNNMNKNSPPNPTHGTRALRASISGQKPVRVLRAKGPASRRSSFAPPIGIRYDGLYRVVAVKAEKNSHDGQYERFRLERLPDQLPLRSIDAPTARQQSEHRLIKQGY